MRTHQIVNLSLAKMESISFIFIMQEYNLFLIATFRYSVQQAELVSNVYLAAFDINCREGAHGAIVLAGTASDAALLIDGDAAVTSAFVAYDADGGGWAMSRTGVAGDPLA